MAEARFHINPATGNPGICRADLSNPRSTGCRYGKNADQHYATREEARESYERQQVKEVYGKSMRASKAKLQSVGETREQKEQKLASSRNRAIMGRFIDLKWKSQLTPDESIELKALERSFEKEAAKLAPEERVKFEKNLRSVAPRSGPSSSGVHPSSFAMGEQMRYLNLKERFSS